MINPRRLVDDVMTMECPQGLERGKNVENRKEREVQLERSLY